ncbi:MAG: hypothetical protein JW751_21080 [Polyangiaceae bacterium]|nr:hypothetical protein [Polyangiaceae bacterium]
MTRRVLLHALAEGIREGTLEAALRALRGFDPWLRARARRRLRALLRQAGALSTVQELPHLLRLSYVMAAAGLPTCEIDDVAAIAGEQAAVAAEVAASSRPLPRRGPWLVGSVVAAAAVVAVAILVGRWWLRPFDPRLLPAGAVLSGPLPALVVAVSGGDPDAQQIARARGSSRQVRRALGDEGAAALAEVMAAMSGDGGPSPTTPEAARHRLTNAVVGLDRALEQQGLPFFVDELSFVQGGRLVPFTMSFYVEREVRVTAGKDVVRVVHLWRLDSVNLALGFLGYTQAHCPAALVLLDQVESDLVRFVLPTLPDGERLELIDRETRGHDEPWVDELERRGGDLVRRWLSALPPAEVAGTGEVGRLLARRRTLIRSWEGELAGLGRELLVPERLIPEAAYSRDLALKVPRKQLYEWDELHRELLREEHLAAFLRLREAYVANVQRHEIEHRIDYGRGLVPVPALLAEGLGLENPLDAPEGGLAARSRQELRAYLAETAQAPYSPVLGLLLLGRNLFAPGSSGGPYWYAARALFKGLAEELGCADRHRLTGRIRPADSAGLLLDVLARDDATLRRGLERLHRRAFGEPIPVVNITADVRHRAWRR